MVDMQPDIMEWLIEGAAAPETAPMDTLDQWRTLQEVQRERWTAPIDRAIAGGFHSDRVAWAFAAGYHNAVRQLVPTLKETAVASLCVTEREGLHPRAINALLVPLPATGREERVWELRGEKTFVSRAAKAVPVIRLKKPTYLKSPIARRKKTIATNHIP